MILIQKHSSLVSRSQLHFLFQLLEVWILRDQLDGIRQWILILMALSLRFQLARAFSVVETIKTLTISKIINTRNHTINNPRGIMRKLKSNS
ncbi:hypothetical protein E3Q23_03624, partial [Wallemia mellicola]